MVVWNVTYHDKRYPKEPIVTSFSNEEAARTMEEYLKRNAAYASKITVDRCCVYNEYKIVGEES